MIKIVTDSASYLPSAFVQENNVSVVPLKVQFGPETYDEITGISTREFYRRLSASRDFPTTSQPAIAEFKETYQKLLSQDPATEILALTISSKLSGTYSTALTAAQQLPQAGITVFDTLSAAMGTGLMVMAAAKMAAAGHPMAEILTRLAQMRRELAIVLMVDDLNYLKRGGRIGAATAFVGTLLDTKPVMALVAGEIQPLDRVRTKRKAIQRMFAELESQLPGSDHPVQAGVMHVAAEPEAIKLGQKIKASFNVSYFFILELGPTVGAHLGPGALGAGFCPEAVSN